MLKPNDRRDRTLVEIERSPINNSTVRICVPGWDHSQKVDFPLELLPDEIIAVLNGGSDPVLVLAKMDLGAETAADLKIGDFELGPPPLTEEELFGDS